MSLVSTLRPVGFGLPASLQNNLSDSQTTSIPFYHEPDYLQLQRMLTRYQNLILLVPSPASTEAVSNYDLSRLQRQIQAELSSPLPYHRTKWLRSVESARNLLLRLERQAQSIKSPKTKKDAFKDLAAKRQIIKRLKNQIEETGREVESLGDRVQNSLTSQDEELLGERADAILARIRPSSTVALKTKATDDFLEEGKPITKLSEEYHDEPHDGQRDRAALFGSSVRRRQAQGKEPLDDRSETDKGVSSGFSNLAQTERSLQRHTHEHEDLTAALVSMAAQLKQQSRAFQFSLTQDENILNRAVEGLDFNITSMAAASKNMAFLRRMSEEQGWLGRLKLYAIILGLWVLAFLLVFAGPKLRF